MRVVLDTNTVVSGFLWDNAPRALIEAAVDAMIVKNQVAGALERVNRPAAKGRKGSARVRR